MWAGETSVNFVRCKNDHHVLSDTITRIEIGKVTLDFITITRIEIGKVTLGFISNIIGTNKNA